MSDHPRVHKTNMAYCEIERLLLDYLRVNDLREAEVCWILSQLAMRWSLDALKASREFEADVSDVLQGRPLRPNWSMPEVYDNAAEVYARKEQLIRFGASEAEIAFGELKPENYAAPVRDADGESQK
jgi:hypothetical protein